MALFDWLQPVKPIPNYYQCLFTASTSEYQCLITNNTSVLLQSVLAWFKCLITGSIASSSLLPVSDYSQYIQYQVLIIASTASISLQLMPDYGQYSQYQRVPVPAYYQYLITSRSSLLSVLIIVSTDSIIRYQYQPITSSCRDIHSN